MHIQGDVDPTDTLWHFYTTRKG